MQQPTIGRIVHYRLTAADCNQINKRRRDFAAHLRSEQYSDTGYGAHVGNHANPGDVLPMMIVRTWGGTCVNGQVLLDGNDTLWVTSRVEGDAEGNWTWPTIGGK